ncbi:MAG: PEP-CTERM sorting domain-containing protein [Luteolibacter sp.]
MNKLFTTLSAGILLTGMSQAATLVLFDFEDLTSNGANSVATSTGTLAGTTTTFLTTAQNSSVSGTDLHNGNRGGSSDAISGTNSNTISFTTAAAGADVTYDSFTYFIGSNSKAYDYAWSYNYAGLGAPVEFSTGTTGATTNFSSIADTLTSFTTSETVTWSLTAIGAAAGGNDRTRFDDFTIEGTVVPEPSSIALLGLGAGALVFRRRRNG